MQREQEDEEGVTRENMSNNNKHQRKSTTATTTGEAQRCPRCDSANTKFCYYNNYSLTQPRYYCKSCRRYWTHGGTLRNVPVGGASRKGKRPKTAAISPSSAAATSDLLSPVSAPASSFQMDGSALEGSQFSYLPAFSQSLQTTFAQALLQPEFHSGSSAMSLLQGFGDGSSSNASFNSVQHGQQFFVNPHFPSGTSSETTMWNMGVVNNNNASASGSALAPNQWPDLPGSYGSPPS